MAYLVLDLDLTTFVTSDDLFFLNKAHNVSERPCTGILGTKQVELKIINRDELTELIEYACTQHDGIIILTSGGWDERIRTELALHLDLSDKVTEKMEHCFYHSAETDKSWFKKDVMAMTRVNKNLRLKKIIAHRPDLENSHFVVLDDNSEHIKSFALNRRVIPITATTNTPSKTFYKEAMNALDECKKNEDNMHLFISALSGIRSNSFFSEVAADLERKRKAEFEQSQTEVKHAKTDGNDIQTISSI